MRAEQRRKSSSIGDVPLGLLADPSDLPRVELHSVLMALPSALPARLFRSSFLWGWYVGSKRNVVLRGSRSAGGELKIVFRSQQPPVLALGQLAEVRKDEMDLFSH